MFRSLAICTLVVAALGVAAPAAAQSNPFSSCKKSEPVRMQSQTPELLEGRNGAIRWTLTGSPVIIVCDDTIFQADLIVYEDDTKLINASGNVNLIQNDMTITAERAEMDGKTKLGTFFNAAGIARVGRDAQDPNPFGTVEPDVTFYGETIEKVAPKKYKIHRGGFSTCAQPTPRWEMTLGDGTITVDEHALMRNVILKVKDVPLLYLPLFYYPMDKEGRSTGFLLPTYGSQTFRGTTLSNAFFWAISRSQDATFFHDWTSKSGQGLGSEYRYVQSSDANGRINFYTFDTPPLKTSSGDSIGDGRRSIRLDGDVNQGLPRRFRLLGRINYFTDVVTQQVYQSSYDSTSQQRSFNASLTGNLAGLRIASTVDRQDSFYGGVGQRNGRMPSLDVSLPDKTIGRSRIYVGASANTSYLVRQANIDSETSPLIDQSLLRFDGGPRIRAPLSKLSFLSATADASWRLTYWSESYDLTDTENKVQVPVGLGRQLFQGRVSLTGPTFSKIFQTPGNGYADRFKHVIEPRLSFTRTTSFADLDRVVALDYSVDGQVGGVTQIDYGIDNKVVARRTAPAGPPGAPPRPGVTRQVLLVSIYQSYYSNALAAQNDPNYQLGSSVPGSFSPLALRATVSPVDALAGDFSMEIDAKVKAIRTLSASSRVDYSNIQVSANWTKRQVIPQLPGFEVGRHSLGSSTLIRSRGNHLGGGYRFDYDFGDHSWVRQQLTAYYNSQCCGISFNWQSSAVPLFSAQGIPSNRQFGISFTLAGIGSVSNPLGGFGGGR